LLQGSIYMRLKIIAQVSTAVPSAGKRRCKSGYI
jgi:hypothetical protein